MAIRQTALLFLACITACTSDNKHPINVAQTTSILTDACPLYVRAVDSDGALLPYPFIRPQHVASMLKAKPLYKGENAILVTLTDVGAKRMHDHTASSVGSKMAVFCGEDEMNRPIILGPVSTSFRVFISDEGGT